MAAARVRELEDVVVTGRSASGRVSEIRIQLASGGVAITGQNIRRVLRPEGLPLLRSIAFELRSERSGNRLARLIVEGRGNGHGVGMCQAGAVGRARAGQTYGQILATYYPGTQLVTVSGTPIAYATRGSYVDRVKFLSGR